MNDVQDIMKQNIQDVLGRGEKLDSVVNKSSALRDVSKRRDHRTRPPMRHARARACGRAIGACVTRACTRAVSCRQASGKYAKDARYLNYNAMLRKYGPLAVVLLLVLGVIYWRFLR